MLDSTPLDLSPEASRALSRPASSAPPAPARTWYQLIHRDYRRYRASEESAFQTILCTQGFWASCFYRASKALVGVARPAPLRKLLRATFSVLQKVIEIVTVGILIPMECDIGEGLHIGHHGTTILPAHGRLGKNCNLGHGVTMGLAGAGDRRGAPLIGNRVFIATHAVVVGKITVGDDAMICAGAVVTRSVPPRGVMVGNPARLISYDGSFDHVVYDGMEFDPERQASLALRGRPDPNSAAVPATE